MKIIILFLMLLYCHAVDLKHCPEFKYKSMIFHKCSGLKEYQNVLFHDITGENDILLVNNKVYQNRGVITSMFKDNELYIAKKKYSSEEWMDAFYNLAL